jgi:hypothetical protein
MSRYLSQLGLATYVLFAAVSLLWWAPHFFAANTHLMPHLDYRYVAATGIPFGLLLVMVAARQSLMPRFSLVLLLWAIFAGLALMLAVVSFYYLKQAVFFCALHLAISGIGFFWHMTRYRRELEIWQKRQAALNA